MSKNYSVAMPKENANEDIHKRAMCMCATEATKGRLEDGEAASCTATQARPKIPNFP
jgi:hypothetical protein